MPTFIVTKGAPIEGVAQTLTVRADTFAADDNFVVFKTRGVVVKAIRAWEVSEVELIDPPTPKADETDDNSS